MNHPTRIYLLSAAIYLNVHGHSSKLESFTACLSYFFIEFYGLNQQLIRSLSKSFNNFSSAQAASNCI